MKTIKLTKESIFRELNRIFGTEDKELNEACYKMIKAHRCSECGFYEQCTICCATWIFDEYEIEE